MQFRIFILLITFHSIISTHISGENENLVSASSSPAKRNSTISTDISHKKEDSAPASSNTPQKSSIISTDTSQEKEYMTPTSSGETQNNSPQNSLTDCSHASLIQSLVNNAENLLKDAKKYSSAKTSCPDSTSSCQKPIDCFDIYEQDPTSKSGIYKVWPKSRIPITSIEVYCDMEEDGGAWTVLQRRGDFESGKDYFYRDWAAYKNGFGNLEEDFWIGNDNIFALTNQRPSSIRFLLDDWEGNGTYATYDDFWIDDEENNYRAHVQGYRGTAGDSFSNTNAAPFSTKDRDNDFHEKNCAATYKGAWWYTKCHSSNLNGYYLKGAHASHADGVEWRSFRGLNYSLKNTNIKIRFKGFSPTKENVIPQ